MHTRPLTGQCTERGAMKIAAASLNAVFTGPRIGSRFSSRFSSLFSPVIRPVLGLLIALLATTAHAVNGPAQADTTSRLYIGVLGGAGAAKATDLQQRGAVHLNHGKLPIDAKGPTESHTSVHLGGVQVGHDFQPMQFEHSGQIIPTAELEALYIGQHSPTGEMPVHPRFLGAQYVTVPTRVGLLMLNATFTFKTPWSENLLPMLGVGAGAAFVSIKGADSANPSEPGINHFNSDPDASDTALALQFRAGVTAALSERVRLFSEYRYLTIGATNYRFGKTDYPGVHQPTDTWRLDMDRQQYHLFVAGLHYHF